MNKMPCLVSIFSCLLFSISSVSVHAADKNSRYCKKVSGGAYDGEYRCGDRGKLGEFFCKYSLKTDGCSVKAKKLTSKVLKRAKGYFYKSCDYHDICYILGKSKSDCDKWFHARMKRECDGDTGKGRKPTFCKTAARLFYEDVSRASRHDDSFDYAQETSFGDKKCGKIERVKTKIDYDCPKWTILIHNDPTARSGKIRKVNGALIIGHTELQRSWLDKNGEFRPNDKICIRNRGYVTRVEKRVGQR